MTDPVGEQIAIIIIILGNFQSVRLTIRKVITISYFLGGSQKGRFQKGGFGGCSPVSKNGARVHSDVPGAPRTGTRVHSDVPWYQKPERGYIRQTALFSETALLFPLEI